MAIVTITPGKGTCKHVIVDIIDGKASKRFVVLEEDLLAGEVDQNRRFETILCNLKTEIKLSGEVDIATIATNLESKEFKV